MSEARAPEGGSEVTAGAEAAIGAATTAYRYNESDEGLVAWARNFTSRIGDGTGDHEQAYLDTLKLIFDLRRDGSLIEIGAGFGRIVALAVPRVSAVVGLEPDFERFRYCHEQYHCPPSCRILQQMSGDFIRENPGARFDVVVLSMVLQHVATDVAEALVADTWTLAEPHGIVVIATTHAPPSASGFTTSGAGLRKPDLTREAFDRYARAIDHQDRGVPVRRFAKQELLDLVRDRFELLQWQQFSYLRPEKVDTFARQLGVPAADLADSGDSQFVVLRKPAP